MRPVPSFRWVCLRMGLKLFDLAGNFTTRCLYRPAHFGPSPWFDGLPQGITQWNRARCNCGRRPLHISCGLFTHSETQNMQLNSGHVDKTPKMISKCTTRVVHVDEKASGAVRLGFFSPDYGDGIGLTSSFGLPDFTAVIRCLTNVTCPFVDSFLKNGIVTNGPL